MTRPNITNTWPAPPGPAAFSGLAGDFVRLVEPHTESDPVALLTQFLVVFGNVIGRTAHFEVEADRHFMNIFLGLVGASSKARKGTSMGHVRRAFEAADPEWAAKCVTSNLSSGEGLIWSVRDETTRSEAQRDKGRVVGYETVIADEGIADKRRFVFETELASVLRVLARDGNTLSAVVRQAWDSGSLRVLTRNSPVTSTGAHISIVGHITRDELLRYMERTELGNGFANRFLWAAVRRSRFLPEGGRVPDQEFLELTRWLQQAVEFAERATVITRDQEARDFWHDCYPMLAEGDLGMFGAVTSRAEAQVVRLSALYALLSRTTVISPSHLQAGLALWNYCYASAAFIFGDAVGDPIADEILRALKVTPAGLTRTEIRDLFKRNRSAAEIGRALTMLQESGIVEMRETRGEAGRPTETWFCSSVLA